MQFSLLKLDSVCIRVRLLGRLIIPLLAFGKKGPFKGVMSPGVASIYAHTLVRTAEIWKT